MWSSIRRQILPSVIAIGLSTTVFFGYLCLLDSPTHIAIYHLDQAASAVFLPVIFDSLLLAILCLGVLTAVRDRPTLRRIFWALVIGFGPLFALKSFAIATGITLPFALKLAAVALSGLTSIFLLCIGWRAADRAFPKVQSFAEHLLTAVGVVGALSLVQAGWFAVQSDHLNDERIANTVAAETPNRPHRRVIWVIFDELAYRQLYGQRLPGLALPAFDSFRAESTIFSDVQPAGISTDIVLPALMTGQSVDRIRSSPQGQLLLHSRGGWHPFNQRNSVFADADYLGYVTAAVGWYNPYCRLLSSVLNSCFWTDYAGRGALFPEQPLRHAILGLFVNIIHQMDIFHLDHRRSSMEISNAKAHIHDFTALDHAADAALADPGKTFIFLHMPVPHPNGIWDRRAGTFAIDHSSYVDNLALADLYLAHVRQLLTSAGQWDNTTIVIEGDHGWRTKLMWIHSPGWSREDELASDGGAFDPRPALLVKLPNEHTSALISTAFPAVRTRSLLDELLERRITTPTQLEHWACCKTQNASAPSTSGGHLRPPA